MGILTPSLARRSPHVQLSKTGSGGTYFITQITYQRYPGLCRDIARHSLRTAINQVREKHPFQIDAFVVLPEHFHCLLTLLPDDHDLSTRLRLIKTYVTRRCNYIHYNPVRHQLCQKPTEWKFSTVHRFINQGIYQSDWEWQQ
jgi:putative transposase